MANVYVYVSEDDFLLEEEGKAFIQSKNIDSFNVIRYNFLDSEPLEILNEITTVSLLGDEKIVVITNPDFLKSNYSNQDIVHRFEEYFAMDNPDTFLVILANFKLDYSLSINATLKRNCHIKTIEDITGDKLSDWIKKAFDKDGYTIDFNAVEELINRTNGEILVVNNEIEKLKLYQEDKHVTKATVELLVSRNLEDNIYTLMTAFLAKDKKKVISIYNDFMALNEDEIRIMNAFQNKLEEILYTKILLSQGLGKDEIASYFRVKPGRAYYMIENAKAMSSYDLKQLISRITNLDYEIKSGHIDKKIGLQLFILGA